ncbi:FtsX-like permease family protein [Arthrobacter sp. Helios]|uniref:FtsX-like permease family protein n=1 Tax=Arthrobacter sp. Helios TaxID=2828862 RepID=UPI002061CCC2|nr:FtsX-like permease family protein [Arthrobacter sp. Helios]UPO78688.1 permease [Arthrobacter sp. Helios]
MNRAVEPAPGVMGNRPLRAGGAVPFRVAWLLARPRSAGRSAALLPVAAFAVVTTLLLTVLAGALTFLTWTTDLAGLYQLLAALALVLLLVPLLTLGASAARLSARRRDANLSTLRLLGATSGTVALVSILESAALALAGSLAGLGGYLLLGPLVQLIPFDGAPLGSAYWLNPLVAAAVPAAVVLLAAASAAAGLRRVVLTPLGVRMRTQPQKAHWLRGLTGLLVIGGVFILIQTPFADAAAATVVILGGFAAGLAVLNLAGPWVIAVAARRRLRRAESPAQLLTARTVLDAPKAAWRQVSGVAMVSFVAVFGGTGVALADGAGGAGPEDYLLQDIRTGILITVITGFLMVACSAAINSAAGILDRADLYVSLDRMGMPSQVIDQARTKAVMGPLLTVSLLSSASAAVLVFPLAGLALVLAPLSVAVIAACLAVGVLLVRGGLRATRPVLDGVLADPAGAGR